MQDLFRSLPDMYVKVSHGFVETLIQTQREELFSGVMRLHYPSGELLLLTFLEGNQQNFIVVRKTTRRSSHGSPGRTPWTAQMPPWLF